MCIYIYIYVALHCDSKQGNSCEVSIGIVLFIVQFVKLCIEFTIKDRMYLTYNIYSIYSMYIMYSMCTMYSMHSMYITYSVWALCTECKI